MATTRRITRLNQLDPRAHYTYADYLQWDFPERVELYKGRVWQLMPGPSRLHQEVSSRLTESLVGFIGGSGCRWYAAPFDVRLPVSTTGGTVDTVVQPDICIVCDRSKLDRRGCRGAPDWVVEILSPGNSKREMRHKFALYEEAGVPEYWVAAPTYQYIQQFTLLASGRYDRGTYFYPGDNLTSSRFPAWTVAVAEVFPEEMPSSDTD